MGTKSSKISCASCNRKKNRYNPKKMNRRISSAHGRHRNEPYGDTLRNNAVLIPRIVSRSRRLGSTRSNRAVSLNAASVPTVFSMHPYNNQNQSMETLQSSGQSNDEVVDSQSHQRAATTFLRNQSKRVGNLLDVNECPEISTISLKSNSNRTFSATACHAHESLTDQPCTPSQALRIDDVAFGSLYISDMTDTASLAVPPNSLNSQFISGVTPFDSVRRDEDILNSSDDSVFEAKSLPPKFMQHYHPEFYLESSKPNPRVLLNNNTISLSPHVDDDNSQGVITYSKVNDSNGPGLDSDFGASAGVSMKMVSSDNTCTDSMPAFQVKTSAMKRWAPHRRSYVNKKLQRKGRKQIEDLGVDKTNSSVSRLYAYYKPLPNSQRLVRSVPRSRPATFPDSSSLHVTMEWDPYDPAYETCHWMEYIIPGVTYPPPPLLNDQQYWL